jgi:hypothetical protein
MSKLVKQEKEADHLQYKIAQINTSLIDESMARHGWVRPFSSLVESSPDMFANFSFSVYFYKKKLTTGF